MYGHPGHGIVATEACRKRPVSDERERDRAQAAEWGGTLQTAFPPSDLPASSNHGRFSLIVLITQGPARRVWAAGFPESSSNKLTSPNVAG